MIRVTMSSNRDSGMVPLRTASPSCAPQYELVAVAGSLWTGLPYARKPGWFMSAPLRTEA